MLEFVDLILKSGRTAVELALFILLPVMIVMLTLMRLLEARGWLDRLVGWAEPLLRPLGVPGLGFFAAIQILFVSFAAPVATLSMMDKGGSSDRHIATTLALVFGLAQANVVLPMAAVGLHIGWTIVISLFSGLIGAALTWHWFGRHLSTEESPEQPLPDHPRLADGKGLLDVINAAGSEAFKIAIGAIPMLVLALLVVNGLRAVGLVEVLNSLLGPLFGLLDVPPELLLPSLTKYIAGGTAMMGVSVDLLNQGLIDSRQINAAAGFLIHPLDLVGIAILISAGPRIARVLYPALFGGLVAVLLRSIAHPLIF